MDLPRVELTLREDDLYIANTHRGQESIFLLSELKFEGDRTVLGHEVGDIRLIGGRPPSA